MPTRNLPNNPSLEHLKGQAKDLRRSDPSIESLAAAQHAVAREYGFRSWAALRKHIETVDRFMWRPDKATTSGVADDFIALACLTYGDDGRWAQAAGLLAADPSLGRASIHVAAAAGLAGAAAAMLAADPSLARAEGGPYNWEPLMYACYSRLTDTDTLGVARVLLDAGADPNVGYLWHGMPSPFTALTGAFGGGEGGQPWHPEWRALARLLLERGADPNDSQTLYNRSLVGWDHGDSEHLALLLEFGLGRGDGGVWHRRMGFTHPTPAQLLQDELVKAAAYNRPTWVRLMIDAGVEVDGIGTDHRTLESHTAWQLATRNGNDAIAAMLRDAGASSASAADAPLFEFLGACMRGDRHSMDTSVRDAAITLRPHHAATAADRGRLDAVRVMAEVGFDVSAIEVSWPYKTTALHRAASNGDLAMVTLLVDLGADPTIRDSSFDGTPRGWAEHFGHAEVAAYLAVLE